MAEAYHRMGITIGIKRLPGERAIHTANSGKTDGELFRKKDGIDQAFKKLSLGRTDIVIDSSFDGQLCIRKLGLKDIHALDPPLSQVESFHYLNVKNRNLLEPLTKVLQQMKLEGSIQGIQKRVEQRF